jgi:hypothetical protein
MNRAARGLLKDVLQEKSVDLLQPLNIAYR